MLWKITMQAKDQSTMILLGSISKCILIYLMNLITWNVRGISNPFKDSTIKNLLSKNRATLVGSIETKLQEISINKINSLWGNSDHKFLASNATATCSGGVLLICDLGIFYVTKSIQDQR